MDTVYWHRRQLEVLVSFDATLKAAIALIVLAKRRAATVCGFVPYESTLSFNYDNGKLKGTAFNPETNSVLLRRYPFSQASNLSY
jgi:hypothetical protein